MQYVLQPNRLLCCNISCQAGMIFSAVPKQLKHSIMSTFSKESYLELLNELVMGKTQEYTWVIDREPGHGIIGTVEQLSAEDASYSITEGGSTVAAHTEHVRWSLQLALKFFKGENPKPDWAESWRIKMVDDKQWKKLQVDLKDTYTAIRTAVEKRDDWSDTRFVTGTLAILPHLAYHLGAIRQMVRVVNNNSENKIGLMSEAK
jgi:hypothetical protein